MNKNNFFKLILVILLVLMVGCAAESHPDTAKSGREKKIAGFWKGLWHGSILPVTFVISLVEEDITIYESFNNRNGYNLGFVVGVFVIPMISILRKRYDDFY